MGHATRRQGTSARFGRRQGALLLLVLGAATCSRGGSPGGAVEEKRSALLGPQQLGISLPSGAGLLGVGLAATNSLRIANSVTMTAPSTGFASAISTGTTATSVGTDTRLINVISQSPATILDRSALSGFAQSASTVSLINGATAAGGLKQNTPLAPLQSLTWTVNVPAATGGDVSLEPDQTRPPLAPGSYHAVTAKTRAVLPLAAGTFFFDSLDIEPLATLNVSAGPVFIYVATSLLLKGNIQAGQQDQKFFIGFLGTSQVSLESAFTGTIVAPNAMLRFAPLNGAGSFTGQFFARDINVEASDTIVLRPFLGWGKLFPLPEPGPGGVHPILTCVAHPSASDYRALFGYFNDSLERLRVAVGAENTFTPAPAGRGQVQQFFPGKIDAAFAIRFGGAATTWTTPGGLATATAQSPACPSTACSPACGAGEACVGGRCVTMCGDGLCGGDEGCSSCPADCGCPGGMVCVRNGCA